MSGTSVFTKHFEAPELVSEKRFFMEPLAPKHNDLDFEAWQSSVDDLQGIFGPGHEWPQAAYTKTQNLVDLERHYREFEAGEAYAYSILSPDQNLCIGCVYIQPSPSNRYDTHVDYWFRNSHKHLETDFQVWLKNWLASEWALNTIALPGREMSWDEYHRLVSNESDGRGA